VIDRFCKDSATFRDTSGLTFAKRALRGDVVQRLKKSESLETIKERSYES